MKLQNDYYESRTSRWDQDDKEYPGTDAISLSQSESSQTGQTEGLCGYSRSKYVDNNSLPHEVTATTATGNTPYPCPNNPVSF